MRQQLVIVGAGAAGLALAKGSAEQGGYEATHLEAR